MNTAKSMNQTIEPFLADFQSARNFQVRVHTNNAHNNQTETPSSVAIILRYSNAIFYNWRRGGEFKKV